jgi:3-deoxy-7-phosphoheptulonate synthase
MIIVMQVDATPAQIDAVAQTIRDAGHDPLVLPGEGRVAIGIPSSLSGDEREQIETALSALDGINKITQTSRPYKLASLEFHRARTIVDTPHQRIGGSEFTIMAGPCSIESVDQLRECAGILRDAGVKVLRGGAFKPRTSPYSFQGLGVDGLKIMQQVGEEFGLTTITEAMSGDMVEIIAEHVDIIQIGARSMQNFPLLVAAGKSGKPVFLKRGPSSGVDEFLLAAEYILHQGNPNVILCERGIIAMDKGYTRNTLDLSVVPVLKETSHLPVIVDPSHGTGVARYVAPMAKAALISGADGLMIEIHPNPKKALSDGSQALTPEQFTALVADLRKLAPFTGVTI